MEPEVFGSAGSIELPSRLTVGLARVPANLAPEAAQFRDQVDQVPNGDLGAGPEIFDRVGAIVALRRQGDSLSRISNVEEFAGGRAVTPDCDLACARPDGLETFPDEGRE